MIIAETINLSPTPQYISAESDKGIKQKIKEKFGIENPEENVHYYCAFHIFPDNGLVNITGSEIRLSVGEHVIKLMSQLEVKISVENENYFHFMEELEAVIIIYNYIKAKIENLPPPVIGVKYIVTREVKMCIPHRTDCIVPTDKEILSNGNIVYKAFSL